MKFNNIREIAIFEHRFWLQILGDHSRFILNALSPKETTFIQQAERFIALFDELLEKVRLSHPEENLSILNQQAYAAAVQIRQFKLKIIERHITGKIDISLSPTFINHMLNELDEYIHILKALIKGNVPDVKDIHLHLLWLLDGSGHAAGLAGDLDMAQKELINKSKGFEKNFNDMYLRAIEFHGYMRTGIYEFPALEKLNYDANNVMTCFKEFLKELGDAILRKEVLGTLSPLMPDHMFREECYYLTKLSMVSKIKAPECDPAKPRIMV